MRVLCVRNEIDDVLARKVGLDEGEPRFYRSITQGKEYVVLGLSFDPKSSCYANHPSVEVENDSGGLSIVPLFMFDIVDSSASEHWKIKFSDDVLTMLPASFYSDFYHDDLSEGIPTVLDDFRSVCQTIT